MARRKTVAALIHLLGAAAAWLALACVALALDSPPAQGGQPEDPLKTFLGNFGSYLLGAAGIITAIGTYVKSRKETTKDITEVKKDIQITLLDAETIKLLKDVGKFVNDEEQAKYARRLDEELAKYAKRLERSESVMFDISIIIDRISHVIPDSKVREKLEADAEKMRENMRKV